MPEKNSIASNCRLLRGARGLSQAELADKVGLSRAGYLKIESGESIPRADTLQRLAKAFGVPIGALVRPVEKLENVRFRSKKRINSREELLSEIKRRLDGYAELRAALGLKPKATPVLRPPTTEPIKAAVALRGLMLDEKRATEPIRDISGLVEARGYCLLLVRLTSAFDDSTETDRADGFFGLSVLGNGAQPAIVVNNFERITVERRIFTVAHELGHLHLHPGSFTAGETQEKDREEKEADVFASHFLMPERPFLKEWGEAYGLPFVDRVLKVKRIFRVSYKTVLKRLDDEGLERDVFPRFLGIYKRRFGRSLSAREEPSPLDDADFKQDVLPSLVRRGVESEVLSQTKAAELLGEDLAEFRERASQWGARTSS